jgi:large repetitive protein
VTHASDVFARLLLSLLVLIGIAGCSGAVSAPPTPIGDPNLITIQPPVATAFPNAPTTFVITGGTGSYIVSSSNQAVIPISGPIIGSTLTVVPNPVLADSPVTLTIRDTGTTTPATASVTVRPRIVNNTLTITPTSTQGGSCAPAICSGGDAEVTATASLNDAPLVGQNVRFDVVSGDFRFITTPPGSSGETLATSFSAVTDSSGAARARIRVLPNASNQTALVQVTHIDSGSFQRTSFAIAQATGPSPGFFTVPSGIVFTGSRQNECAGSGASANVFIFGGVPPYNISNTSSAFLVDRNIVSVSGGSFNVRATGICVPEPGMPIAVTDSAARTLEILVQNLEGTQVVPALVVAPQEVSLSSCNSVATITVAGGTGNYVATSGSGSVLVSQASPTSFTIQRHPTSAATSSPVNVGISDGRSVANVTVTLTGTALGACPGAGFTASPTAVTLNDCSGAAQVTLTGGSGTYSAATDNTGIQATVNANIVSIRRVDPSGPFSGGTVAVSDGAATIPIAVSSTGAGAGSCPSPAASSFTATPPSVELTDCVTPKEVVLSGGTPGYSVTSNHSSIMASFANIFSNVVRIVRRSGTGAVSSPQTVSAYDSGSSSFAITVNLSGSGAAACP